MRALLGDGALHHEHERDEWDRKRSKGDEGIEIGERGRLLLAQVVEQLQRHLLGSHGIAAELKQPQQNESETVAKVTIE